MLSQMRDDHRCWSPRGVGIGMQSCSHAVMQDDGKNKKKTKLSSRVVPTWPPLLRLLGRNLSWAFHPLPPALKLTLCAEKKRKKKKSKKEKEKTRKKRK